MIEQTFYFALAANWLMQNPVWQSFTVSKIVRNPKFNNPYEYPRGYEPDSFEPIPKETNEEYANRIANSYAYEKAVPRTLQKNWFNRKPFTCLYCITFWLVVFAVVGHVLLVGSVPSGWACMFTAPVVAEAFNRWFKSLPVKF